jgi:protein-tyrosine phosphatase
MRGRGVVTPIVDALVASAGYRTSTLRPIFVDWLDLEAVPGLADAARRGARLGMSILPGKQVDGFSGPHWRDLEADARRLSDVEGVDRYLLLVEDHELETADVSDLIRVFEELGVAVLHHPVVDMSIPADADDYAETLARVRAWLDDGSTVLVTCRGGLGRTGTAVACLLVDAGLDSRAAIRLTREARPGAIERGTQVEFVDGWRGSGQRVGPL